MDILAIIVAGLVFIYGICYEPHAIQKSKAKKKNRNIY